jgi:hypothetical protein
MIARFGEMLYDVTVDILDSIDAIPYQERLGEYVAELGNFS